MKKRITRIIAFVFIILVTGCNNIELPTKQDYLSTNIETTNNSKVRSATSPEDLLPVESRETYDGIRTQMFSGTNSVSVALCEDGSLWTWGKNSYGQLGNGYNGDGYDFDGYLFECTPTRVMEEVRTFVNNGTNIFALKKDNSLWAWGLNDCGQVGNGALGDIKIGNSICQSVPVKILEDVESIYADYKNVAAIKKDKTLWIWGDNSSGQVGIGDNEDVLIQSVPVKVLDNVHFVELKYSRTSAITSDGTLWVWGRGGYQLGTGKTVTENKVTTYLDSYYPEKILENVESINLSQYNSAAIQKDGTLWIWGSNHSGQVGNGKTGMDEEESTPQKIMTGIKEVWHDDYHTVALDNNGGLWTWGGNIYGVLGNGTPDSYPVPNKIMNDVKKVYAEENITLVIKNDGSLWAWGYDYEGFLGIGKGTDMIYEQAFSCIPNKIMEDVKDVYVSATGIFNVMLFAIKPDCSLWAWGKDSSSLKYSKGGTPVMIVENVDTVSQCEYTNIAVIKKDGSLYIWGDNYCGQIGNGTKESSSVPVQVKY